MLRESRLWKAGNDEKIELKRLLGAVLKLKTMNKHLKRIPV